jgi:hypothetical protein
MTTAATRTQSFQRARRQIAARLPAGCDSEYERGYRDAMSTMLMQLQAAAVRTDDVEAAVSKTLDAIGTGAGSKVQFGVFSAEQIGTVSMLDIVGECDPSGGAAEWAWVDQRATFKAPGVGAFGSRIAVLSLAPDALDLTGEVPPLLAPVIREAQVYGLAYLTFRLPG